MAVLINCFILCVLQFNLVRSTGINLPFTSISYKASPINPKFLSLVFSANDSVESKTTDNLEDLKPFKTSLSTQDEGLSKKTVSVSELLSKLGLISDNDSNPKDLKFSKQKQNVDPDILYEVASPPQKNVSNLRTNMNDKSYIPKDFRNKKNPVNYNIKIISPPAVFNNLPISLPVTQNVGGTKILSEINQYSKNEPPISLLPYPVRSPTDEVKQKSTTEWQNARKTLSNNKEATKYKTVEPLVQKNIINIAEHDGHQMRNLVKSEDMIVTPKDNAKFTCDLNINETPFNIDTRSNNLLGYSSTQIPIKLLDTCNPSLNQNLDIVPTMCDAININQEMKPSVSSLSMHDAEFNKDKMSTFNNMIDKQIPNYCSVQNILSETPLSYVSAHPYTFDISPTLPKFSSPNLLEILEPQQTYISDADTYNLRPGSSLDNIVSFLTSKFILAYSAQNSIRAPLRAPEILQSHITTDAPDTLSETPMSFPVCVSSNSEVKSPTYLPKPDVDIPLKENDKKAITKTSVPYISSVTINYMPCIESSDDIIIIV